MADGGSTVLRGYAERHERPTSPVLLRSRSPVRGYSEVQKMPASYGLVMEGQAEVLFHNLVNLVCTGRRDVCRDKGRL